MEQMGPIATQGASTSGNAGGGGGGALDAAEDLYSAGRSALDLLGIGEAYSAWSGITDGWTPGAGVTPGADKVLKPIGYLTSAIDLYKGGTNLHEGIKNDDGVKTVDGIHDLIGGTAGALSMAGGPVGAVAQAFGAGFAVGDMIAPAIFGSEKEDNKAKMVDVPEDGVFKPSTGNKYVDSVLDVFGIRD